MSVEILNDNKKHEMIFLINDRRVCSYPYRKPKGKIMIQKIYNVIIGICLVYLLFTVANTNKLLMSVATVTQHILDTIKIIK